MLLLLLLSGAAPRAGAHAGPGEATSAGAGVGTGADAGAGAEAWVECMDSARAIHPFNLIASFLAQAHDRHHDARGKAMIARVNFHATPYAQPCLRPTRDGNRFEMAFCSSSYRPQTSSNVISSSTTIPACGKGKQWELSATSCIALISFNAAISAWEQGWH